MLYMAGFPRTEIGGLSVSRLIIGTNWFLGWSHKSPAKDQFIKDTIDRRVMAEILTVFFENGVDTIMGLLAEYPVVLDAIKEAEDKTGRKCIKIDTPILNVEDSDQARGEAEALLDRVAAAEVDICLPHHSCVEQLLDKGNRKIHRLPDYLKMIRDRNMIPGLSAHMPEVVLYADLNDYDVETYIQIYNCLGFLMQLEVEWIAQIIQNAKKPVITIKPLAAGRTTPFVGLNFVWNTIREQDMVTIGTMTPQEAREVVEMSRAVLERRFPNIAKRATPRKDEDAQ
jgi:hypothetical protein